MIATKNFSRVIKENALQRPIPCSDRLHIDCVPVKKKQLHYYVATRFKVLKSFIFY